MRGGNICVGGFVERVVGLVLARPKQSRDGAAARTRQPVGAGIDC